MFYDNIFVYLNKIKNANQMKTITKTFLEKHNACESGMDFVIKNKMIGLNPKDFILELHEKNHNDWANWLIVQLLTRKQKIQFAIFAAEQVIDIFEKKYPDNDKPRKAIEAAKLVLKSDTKKNRDDADAAADDADDAAYVAAAYAAAAYAAYAAAAAAYAAAYADAADAATRAGMRQKQINQFIAMFGE